MNRQLFTRIHLSENSVNKLKNIRDSFIPRKSVRQSLSMRQFSVYALNEPSKGCQNVLLSIVIIQLIVLIGICVTSQLFPNLMCQYFINCTPKCSLRGKAKYKDNSHLIKMTEIS